MIPKSAPTSSAFTSSSTAKNFVALLGPTRRSRPQKLIPLHGVRFASIGPVTSATLRELGLPVDTEAKVYTIPGLIKAIVTLSALSC